MSKAVSVLNGASFAGLAEVKDAGLVGMITLRGDLSSATLQSAVTETSGCAVPDVRRVTTQGGNTVAWMSPDELMIVVPYAAVEAKVAELTAAVAGEHALVANVSDARAYFQVSGNGARETMAKIAPVDFDAAAFEAGDFRRTRLAQVAGAFWLDDAGAFHIICFRSVGQYVFDLLRVAANPKADVGIYE